MKNRSVAVIAAHPDDEILGCGGTINKHIELGDEVHVLIVSEGITSRDEKRDIEINRHQLENLITDAKKANKYVGSTTLEFLLMPDNRMDSIELLSIIKKIESFKKKKNPEIVYTHYSSDINIDHQKVHDAVMTAFRPTPGEITKKILCFETLSSTEWQPPTSRIPFNPNCFVMLSSKNLNQKLKALKAYATEMRDFPHPRSIDTVRTLASYRGSTVGVPYAESFVIVRSIS